MTNDHHHHEDGLLNQRVYNFVTLNAFLATIEAIAVALNPPKTTIGLGLLTGFLGLVFALLQTSRGIRTVRTLQFGRLYLESIEHDTGLLLDSTLFGYFRKGTAMIFGGRTITTPQEGVLWPIRSRASSVSDARPSATRLPIGDQWRYEPNLDGFRGLLWRRGDAVHLLTRNLKDLTHWFPELANAGKALPPNTLVDGEIIIVNAEGASDFGALRRRRVAMRDLPGAALLEVAAEDRYRAGRYWGAMPRAFCSDSIHSWPLSSLVVRADLTAPPAAKASATAAAEVSPGASKIATTSYSPKQ